MYYVLLHCLDPQRPASDRANCHQLPSVTPHSDTVACSLTSSMEVLSSRVSPHVIPANLFSLRTHVFCSHAQDNAMPPYPVTPLQDSLSANSTRPSAANPPSIPVVCAWPVSGQYGAGSRILFYVLIAACLIARKNEWIRNACLAGALLFPAIAALHAITLAALHSPGKPYSGDTATMLSSESHNH